jgi:glycosyltransferase involved in cell wall biosynthesis
MDMQQQHFPEYFSKAELQYRKNNFKKSVEDSDAVIAISEFTASDIKKYYGKNNASKVKVIHIARPNQPKIAETNATFARYRPYFIYPAATWPHKNHERLIKAFRDVATKHPEYKLLLTGMDRQKTNDIKELISKLGLENNIYVLGYLPYGAMPSLYEQSFGLVFPSLFEGFGIPLLEAMRYKKPIASSDSSSLPEVGGKAAIYFNPIDTNSMSASMIKLIEDDALRKRLLIESKKQLSRFSLLGMINKTLEVYNKLTDEE